MAQNKLSNFIASMQMLNIGVINNDNKYTTNLEIGLFLFFKFFIFFILFYFLNFLFFYLNFLNYYFKS